MHVDWKKKKKPNLRAENYVLLGPVAEDLSPGDHLLDALRDRSEGVREEPGYTGDFAGSQNTKRFLLIEEKQAISS